MFVSGFRIFFLLLTTAITILTMCRGAGAKATARIYLGRFSAPPTVRCDLFTACNFRFHICVDNLHSGHRMSECEHLSKLTPPLGRSPINLAVTSPLEVSIDKWEGGFKLKVEVLDYDRFSKDDVIEQLSVYHKGHIGTSATYTAQKRTRLSVTISTSCDPHYYGPQCATFCDDATDRYRCHPVLGTKICFPGWTGSNCQQRLATTLMTSVTEVPFTTTEDLQTAKNETGSAMNTTLSLENGSSNVTSDLPPLMSVTDWPSSDNYDPDTQEVDDDGLDNGTGLEQTDSDNLKWFCGQSILASTEDFNTSQSVDDAVSAVIGAVLNEFSAYPNSTLDFDYVNPNETCNLGDGVHAIRFDYCLQFDRQSIQDLHSMIESAYDRTTASTVGVELLSAGCDHRQDPRQHRRGAEAQNADKSNGLGLMWGVTASLAMVFLVLAAAAYVWIMGNKRKASDEVSEDAPLGSLSFSSPVYCPNDEPTLAIMSDDGIYSSPVSLPVALSKT